MVRKRSLFLVANAHTAVIVIHIYTFVLSLSPPVPAISHTLCLYVTFLACSRSYSSTCQNLNVVWFLQKELDLPNPLLDNWPLTTLLTGIKHSLGQTPSQKLPITFYHLPHIKRTLHRVDTSFLAPYLVVL